MAEELKAYIGVKQLQARPMTRGEYSDYRGVMMSADSADNEPGYLVVYPQPDGSTYELWRIKHLHWRCVGRMTCPMCSSPDKNLFRNIEKWVSS